MNSKEWRHHIRALAPVSRPDDMEEALLADFESAECRAERERRHRKWALGTARRNMDSWVFQVQRGDDLAEMVIKSERRASALGAALREALARLRECHLLEPTSNNYTEDLLNVIRQGEAALAPQEQPEEKEGKE